MVAEAGRARARIASPGSGEASVATGIPVLDHLLALAAQSGRFDLTLEVAPGAAAEEAAACGRALGDALRQAGPLAPGAGHALADEALAQVVLESSDRPGLFSNVDLSAARVAGLRTDVIAGFLDELAEGAGLTIHVRLIEGKETEHVLEAIFKALGAALGQALTTT
jgi:imidazoleglycerol-phosphate dehydratase